MSYPVKVAIAGDLGSGKTRICGLVCEVLGAEKISTGDLHRKIAAEKNMTTLELNQYSESHPEVDAQIDAELQQLRESPRSVVFDSRVAWHFVPQSFKIYLLADPEVAAQRIMTDPNRHSEQYENREEAVQKIYKRKQSENRRFREKYHVDCSDLRNYDLIIDTSDVDPEPVAQLILKELRDRGVVPAKPVVWVSPKSLFPTQSIRALGDNRAKEILESIKEHGFQKDEPVAILHSGRFKYIYDGHRRSSASLLSGVDLIPTVVAASGQEEVMTGLTADEYAKNECTRVATYDWEDIHGFRFREYPSWT